MTGIVSAGAYLPRRRLQRASIAAANTWFDPGLASLAKGERTMCSWDEDVVTLAAEAARAVLRGRPVEALFVGSTSFPFMDRSNAVLVGEALGLPLATRTLESAGTRRAGTCALLSGLDLACARPGATALVVAAEHRVARVGTAQELSFGDGAAAVVLGSSNVIAQFLGSHTHAADFVDHYRGEGQRGVYSWEDRWIRDAGLLEIIPAAVRELLTRTGTAAADLRHVVFPGGLGAATTAITRAIGIDPSAVIDSLHSRVGDTGAAHPLLLLNLALARAQPGECILVSSFGQGCDALLFRATALIESPDRRPDPAPWLERGVREDNYSRFQSFNGLVDRDLGKRAESDRLTRLSAFNRDRELLTSFAAGVCNRCATVQIPCSSYCVNPACGTRADFSYRPLANTQGTVMTWTADRLTYDADPPAYFGMVNFDGGGRLFMDFTEVQPGTLDVGTRVGFHFRIKEFDTQRGFRRYFWKAAPL